MTSTTTTITAVVGGQPRQIPCHDTTGTGWTDDELTQIVHEIELDAANLRLASSEPDTFPHVWDTSFRVERDDRSTVIWFVSDNGMTVEERGHVVGR